MARPRKQTVDYFPHYADASNRKTLYILESKFGNDGYAFWFKLLEILANSEGHVYDARNPAAWEFLLAKTRTDGETGSKIMELLVDLEAIDRELWEQGRIWSQNLVDNVTDVYRNRKVAPPQKPSFYNKEPAASGVFTPENPQGEGVSTAVNPQTKPNETKPNETKEEDPPTVPPSVSSPSSSVSDDRKDGNINVFELYEQEIGKLTPTISEELKAAEKEYPVEWIADAVRVAARAERRSWRYIEGILKRWQAEGRVPTPTGKEDPNKYVRGKYGHMVRR